MVQDFNFKKEMQSKDRAEKETSDAKNAVEEYVYYMRDKLSDVYAEFISNEVRLFEFLNYKITWISRLLSLASATSLLFLAIFIHIHHK